MAKRFGDWLQILIQTFFLMGFWVLLSGKLDRLHLSMGLLGSLAVAWVSHSPGRSADVRKAPLLAFRGVIYGAWLLLKIFQAAIHVTRVILARRLSINPALIHHKTRLATDVEKVIFANSITLTPGTITVDVAGDTLTVHQLDPDSAGDIVSGGMEKEIHKIFSGRVS